MCSETVDPALIGVVWPPTHPGEDPILYGHAELTPKGAFEARSIQTFKLVYTVGRYGIDDTGGIKVVFRFAGDQGDLQMDNPTGYNYVTAHCSTGARIQLEYGSTAHARPWFKALTATLHGGYLREGDQITIIFGDPSKGSPGMRLQTFCETDFEFKVVADVCAVKHYVPLVETPSIVIEPGPPALWRAALPSLRRPGERFQLGIKAEDRWGNPTHQAEGRFRLVPSLPVEGLPEVLDYPLGERAVTLENLKVQTPGELRIAIYEGDERVAEAGPLIIREGDLSGYWGDLHGQSGESLGTGASRQYFDFARNKSFLDVTSHQANDFQINNAFWQYLNELTAEFHEDHRFVTFPGYEWSGNTAVGGDRNVFFRTEGRQIHRSSHALLTDRSDINTDAPNAARLFEMLDGEDCCVWAHVGGRYADITYAHDGRYETAMEVHSAWGTFEWLLTDGFPLGHRSGVVCNSDGHKGRPGASYPGASKFGAYGGLTCFLTDELTRDGIFDSLRKRHHYGTTGCRMHLDVRARLPGGGQLFERDPNVFPDAGSRNVNEVMMGDIIQTSDTHVELDIEVAAHAPIERVEVRNGADVVEVFRPYAEEDLGSRIRVVWSGAEYRGRGRQTTWTGRARFGGARLRRIAKINAWNPERRLEQTATDTVEWNALTTGNYGGFDAWLEGTPKGNFDLTCNHGAVNCPMDDIGYEDTIMEAGGLERRIRVYRLPEENPHRNLTRKLRIPLNRSGDNPLWVCVYTEDGFQAWSSPIFLFK
ncbi:MAG: DUF3604 domain-containing protein [Aquisalimonadaceae bacterium]